MITKNYWKKFNLKIHRSGSGGGGSSGKVDFPAHMKVWHKGTLDHNGLDVVSLSITDAMNALFGNSPYSGESSYNPDTSIASSVAAVDDLDTMVALLSSGNTLDSIIANVLADSRIDNAVDEFSSDLGDRLLSETIPRFEAGMRNINAVTSSAFAIGRGIIEANQTRQVAQFSAGLHMKAFGDDALRLIALKLESQKILTQTVIENNRINTVLKKEETEANLNIDKADATWDIGLFQYGGNLLASIGGGAMIPESNRPSREQTAVGGAMAGAATGAMIGTPGGNTVTGAAIGAVVGGAAAYYGY